jgi:hypothetical protein
MQRGRIHNLYKGVSGFMHLVIGASMATGLHARPGVKNICSQNAGLAVPQSAQPSPTIKLKHIHY